MGHISVTNDDGLQKSEYVYLFLRERILLGQYAPGQTILPAALISHFGFSHVPVREALKNLEDEGYIVHHRWRAMAVRSWSAEQFENSHVMRNSLLALSAKRATVRANENDIKKLQALVHFSPKNWDKLSPDQSEELINRSALIAAALTEISGIEFATDILSRIFPPAIHRLTIRTFSAFDAQLMIKSLQAMIEGIAQGSPGTALSALDKVVDHQMRVALPVITKLEAMANPKEVNLSEGRLDRSACLPANHQTLYFGRGLKEPASIDEFLSGFSGAAVLERNQNTR